MSRLSVRRRRRGFTLVELLVVIGMIALLAGLGFPAYRSAIASAQSTQCAANLRLIGVALTQAASDNDNQYPAIVQDAGGSTGTAGDYTGTGVTPTDLFDALSPYGITEATLKCPSDNGQVGYSYPYTVNGKNYTSSYEWNPIFDDEVVTSPVVYVNGQMVIPMNSSRVRLCTDFNAVHHGHVNALYGDGHVKKR